MSMNEKQLLSTKAVAAELGVTSRTVAKWIRDGELTAVRLGRIWRVRREALDDFICGRPVKP